MTTQPPQACAYQLPDGASLSVATGQALDASGKARDQLGRVMAVVTAASYRDILTGREHDAPFDAAHAELVARPGGALFATGRYWTAAGEERLLCNVPGLDFVSDMSGLGESTSRLDDSNAHVWRPLCTELPDPSGHGRPFYRFDLAKAAGLPLD